MSSGGGLVKIVGIDKGRLREFLDLEVAPEVWDEFVARRNGALLGIDIANDEDINDRYVWKKGSEFVMADFGDLSLYMAGTFTPSDPTLRSVILVGDIILQESDGQVGIANQLIVSVRHHDDGQRVAAAIDALDAPVKLHAETMQAAFDQAVEDLDEMLRYAGHVILVVGLVIFVGLANTTSMSVRDRRREVGVLRALGFTRRRITALIAGESLLLALFGGLIGCVAAWGALRAASVSVSVGSYAFPVTVAVSLVLAAVAAAALVGVAGGLPAGIGASRRPIVESLRSAD
ncbi:MAG: ABC transporter permease [Planctomycetota bacterium]|jgi:putative ABC transport system permease protein